ncbi:ATP-dependent nuclease [Chitinophaga sp. LS1]|uniref:ATP-dependent nuclease n=1 Tax=Chitinophaga sp. LS1 TaxID=3051176 RepID=UPI002AAAA245|nr:AAA family ATPase [Chitinophaga sp. LS1]WPV67115.1 AAA family ATPase [Chitinophaga sp. LS1]
MQIKKLVIKNYRNLDGQKVSFADNCNFIVGENNLGKSNLLSIFQIIFTNRAFKYEDFTDVSKPIEIGLQLKLEEIEIGHFEDLFDTDDYHLINIVCRQLTTDDNIEFYHLETNTFIVPMVVRCINYIHYDSLRNPLSEINFNKGRGVGRFMSNMILNYLEEKKLKDIDFVNEEKINEVLESINAKISKIKTFNDFKINASSENDLENLLSRIIVLKDEKGNSLDKTGYGVQFLLLITLSILERIQSIKNQGREKGIFEHDTDHTKYISLVIGLDEPEIHLHPYMQRSLVKYLNKIISSKNPEFQKLVKDLFDIDGFNGQIIIATHSPNILLNDYKQIIRLYPDNGLTKIKSGTDVSLEDKHSKRLHMHFPSIKEAFFSRCVIFVEGDSEESSFPSFAEKMSIDFDELGISVIQSRGGEVTAIKLLMELVSNFDIPSTGIGDRDNNTTVTPPLYLTIKKDFEEELVSLIDVGRESFLNDLVKEFEGEDAVVQSNALNKYAVKSFKIITTEYTADLKLSTIPKSDTTNLKAFYLTWLSGKKSYPLGRLIGENITLSDIPAIYKTVILKAVELSK